MPPITVRQLQIYQLAHPYRGQAPSHISYRARFVLALPDAMAARQSCSRACTHRQPLNPDTYFSVSPLPFRAFLWLIRPVPILSPSFTQE